jgi:hypothetical protein
MVKTVKLSLVVPGCTAQVGCGRERGWRAGARVGGGPPVSLQQTRPCTHTTAKDPHTPGQACDKPCLPPRAPCRWLPAFDQPPTLLPAFACLVCLPVQGLFESVYGSDGSFLRRYHEKLNGDPGAASLPAFSFALCLASISAGVPAPASRCAQPALTRLPPPTASRTPRLPGHLPACLQLP